MRTNTKRLFNYNAPLIYSLQPTTHWPCLHPWPHPGGGPAEAEEAARRHLPAGLRPLADSLHLRLQAHFRSVEVGRLRQQAPRQDPRDGTELVSFPWKYISSRRFHIQVA